jgi:5-methylcytosine-specific restriction endonuclease McrA
MSPPLRQFVRERAGRRCKYCRFREEHLLLWPFHLDHVVARQHGGSSDESNLAWSCHRCNLRKGTTLTARDPDSASVVPLFNPRTDLWESGFELSQGRIIGRTAPARATAWLLQMNVDERVRLRRTLVESGSW